MSSGTPPEGWDEVDPELLEAARGMRKLFIAFVAAGFTTHEAALIIAANVAATNQSSSLGNSGA